jgi:hypothetical protein
MNKVIKDSGRNGFSLANIGRSSESIYIYILSCPGHRGHLEHTQRQRMLQQ